MKRRLLALLIAATLTMANGQVKITLCHFGTTKDVPERSVAAHLGHGDYLGECQAPDPEPTSAPANERMDIWLLWLLRSDEYPGWDCLIWSSTHPSVERQNQLCWPDIVGDWEADHSWAALVYRYEDGSTSWALDALTPWRLR